MAKRQYPEEKKANPGEESKQKYPRQCHYGVKGLEQENHPEEKADISNLLVLFPDGPIQKPNAHKCEQAHRERHIHTFPFPQNTTMRQPQSQRETRLGGRGRGRLLYGVRVVRANGDIYECARSEHLAQYTRSICEPLEMCFWYPQTHDRKHRRCTLKQTEQLHSPLGLTKKTNDAKRLNERQHEGSALDIDPKHAFTSHSFAHSTSSAKKRQTKISQRSLGR